MPSGARKHRTKPRYPKISCQKLSESNPEGTTVNFRGDEDVREGGVGENLRSQERFRGLSSSECMVREKDAGWRRTRFCILRTQMNTSQSRNAEVLSAPTRALTDSDQDTRLTPIASDGLRKSLGILSCGETRPHRQPPPRRPSSKALVLESLMQTGKKGTNFAEHARLV